MDLKELKQVTDELSFLLESIKRESAMLSGANNGIENHIKYFDNFIVEIGKPFLALQKLIENIASIQNNIDGAVDVNRIELEKTISRIQTIVQTFEERAGGIIDKIDFSNLEKSLSNNLNRTVDNVVESQKSHLEILKKVVISLNAASDRLNRDSQTAVSQIDASNTMMQQSVKDFNDQVKKFSLMTIIPWAVAASVLSSVIVYELTSSYYEDSKSDLQRDLSYFSDRVLPDNYYTTSNDGKTLLLNISLRDPRVLDRTRDRVMVKVH